MAWAHADGGVLTVGKTPRGLPKRGVIRFPVPNAATATRARGVPASSAVPAVASVVASGAPAGASAPDAAEDQDEKGKALDVATETVQVLKEVKQALIDNTEAHKQDKEKRGAAGEMSQRQARRDIHVEDGTTQAAFLERG